MLFPCWLRNRRAAFPRAAKARAAARRKAAVRTLHLEALEDRCLPSTAGSLVNLPLSFEANVGQADAAARYVAHGSGYALALTGTGAALDLHQAATGGQDALLQMQLVGGSAAAAVVGLDPQAGHSNYLIGNDPSQWHTDVPLFGRVEYQQVYAGIDVVYYGNDQHQLEYDFVVAAGADPGQIGLRFAGAQGLEVDNQGNLVLHLAGGDVMQRAPVVYQDVGGVRTPVAGAYVLRGDGSAGITVGRYDPTHTLVLDPVLVYSTYLGGSENESGIAVDGSGNAYITGETNNLNGFPITNAEQGTFVGQVDAYVAKLNAAGTALVYATYLGGGSTQFQAGLAANYGVGIAVDGAGNAYVTGNTDSIDFPSANPVQAKNLNAFVAKLNAAGDTLVYASYLGGSGQDYGRAIAVDGAGNAYVTGNTDSTDFPITLPMQQVYAGGDSDAFVAKLNPAGTIFYATYLGGSADDVASGIAVDGSGNAYVTGTTFSSDFPTINAEQATFGGGVNPETGQAAADAFVTKLNPFGFFLYSTYLGGSGSDGGLGIAVDGSGNAYVTGGTFSSDFPKANPLQATLGGIEDAFVAKLNATGNTLVYSTYLGGSVSPPDVAGLRGIDQGFGIAVDGAGNAYVTGLTSSTDFPTAHAVQPTLRGDQDAFVAKLNPTGNALVYSTYLGGSSDDVGKGIAVDSAGNAYVSGYTTLLPYPEVDNPVNAFVAKIPDIGPLTYTTPQDSAMHMLTLRRNGADLELFDNGALVRSRVYANTTSVSITAATLFPPFSTAIPALLTIDNAFGGLIGLDIDFFAASSLSPLTVTTTSAADTLTLAPGRATLDTTQVITFNVQGLIVNGSADDTVVLTGGAGPDRFAVTPSQATLNNYTLNGFGTVTADGQGGDTLTVDDSAATGPVNYDLAYNSVSRSGLATILYSGMTSLELDGGSGGNTINVISTSAGTPTTINAGTGPNTIDLGRGVVGFLQGDLTVNGQGSTNALTVNDSAFYGPVTYDLGLSTVRRSGAATIHYSGITSLELDGGKGGNTINVTSTAAGCATTLNGGSGQDTFTGSFSGDFNGSLALTDFEAATLDVSGNFNGSLLAPTLGTLAAPMDQIAILGSIEDGSRIKVGYLHTLSVNQDLNGTVDGYGPVTDPSTQFTIGPVTVGGTWGSGGSITAPSIQSINMQPASVFAGHATETTPAADFQSLNLGTVASTGSIIAGGIVSASVSGDMAGVIAVSGSLGTLTVGGSLTGAVTAATLDSLTVGQDLTGHVTVLQSMGNLVVGGSLLGDVNSPVIASANINGTANDDTFVISPTAVTLNGSTVLSGTYGTLTVNGLAGNDLFILAGTNMPATLNGGAGNDTFQFNDGASITGAIDGQDGFDTLDYRAYTTPASVDLGTGVATGVTGGVQNIENVLGATTSITVTNTADSGPGSLRQAILAANAHPGHDTIAFHMAGSGVQSISPTSPLPDITDPVTIDGYSQPGASVNTVAVGDNAVLLIQLDGSNAGVGANGLHITAGNSTVQGLMIDNFTRTPAPSYLGGNAILLDTNAGNVIQGNIVGTHGPGGYLVFSNANDVTVDLGSSGNLIGGTTPAARNILSGAGSGVDLFGSATHNLVQGNYIGTDATGTLAVPNFDGVVDIGQGTTIGGTAPGAGNVISGNTRTGIVGGVGGATLGNFIGTDASGTALLSNGSFGIFRPSRELIGGTATGAHNLITGNSGICIFLWVEGGNVVQGNSIGTDITSNAPLGDPANGIAIQSSNNNVVGGTTPGAHNVMANCFQVNVYLLEGSTGNVVEGNRIGTNAAGTSALGVNGVGVLINTGALNNTIGGTTLGAGNLVSGNTNGVQISDAGSTGNVVEGNYIGTDATGTFAVGNVEGVNVLPGAFSNTIGGTTAAARNVISGNTDGFFDASGATTAAQGTVVEGNYVGLNAAGTAAIPNTEDGVDPGSFDTIGGTAPGAGNVISGNRRAGMVFFASNVVVQGNLIGTDATGTFAVGNNWGILAGQTAGNLIGGTTAAARNVISGNILGIEIAGNYAHDNVIQGNYIGINAAGTAALGNASDGVFLAFTSANTIGGTAPGAGNVISGNGLYGIELASSPGFDAANNLIEGNFIGTDAAGTGAVGNHSDGVYIYAGAHDNLIGAPPTGSVAGFGNTIAFNGGAGVAVLDATSINNSIRGNSIHDNAGLGIDLGNDGVTLNAPPPRTGPNNLQNFPVIQVAGEVAGGTGVVGGLDCLPLTAYTVDFYANAAADPSGYGQGQTYLGSTSVTTDKFGHASFALLLPAVASGSVITATATDPAGNTSEFAADASLQPLADLDVSAAGVVHYRASAGVANNLTVRLAGGPYTLFTDTGERIFITGAGSAGCAGTGTNIVTCPATSIFVDTSDGNDTVTLLSAFVGMSVTIDGGSGNNTLLGPDAVNTWQLTGANQGNLNGNITFRNIQNLTGGPHLGDTFAFATGATLSGTLDGGGGVSTLDYSAYTGNIVVDLPLGTATGVVGGISHIQNVTGSIGNDLIVGDANPNVLIGGTGRNVLIGGAGADTLKEVAANTGDNLLIGGTTNYDTNLAALNAIFAEWTRTDLGFKDRASDLLNGTNGQGATPLNTVNGQLILLNNATVHADNAADVLTGGGKGLNGTGTGRNWFFVDADDIITNFRTGKNGDKKTLVR